MIRWIFVVGLISLSAKAENKIHLEINDGRYDLKIEMQFANSDLGSVIQGFKSPQVLQSLSPAIESIQIQPPFFDRYDSIMTIRSLGVASELISHCEEAQGSGRWSRRCVLDTHQKNGGDYMVQKSDSVECRKEASIVVCQFSIQGETKPLTIYGVPLMSASRLTVRTKAQAMQNFLKQYQFIQSGGYSTRFAIQQFGQSRSKLAIEEFMDKADRSLRKKSNYVFDLVGFE